ncbi:MAG TPA: NADH-quinone oxidoreductase subunit N, partial [Myxococcota bacterium]|nr:NADH-quinone oxidoreductase subunit N [Myxococcota bacterium]
YFILGSLASGFLLYGMSLLYGITGSLQLQLIQTNLVTQANTLSVIALIFILAGIAFKFGAVPFHMWVPDLYDGAPTPVTLFIASAPKVAAFVMTVRLLGEALSSIAFASTPVLIGIAVLSMAIGNVLAIAQTSIKRMLAYSSIAHVGYTLLGVLVAPIIPAGYSAAMFYIVSYALVAAGGFAIVIFMSEEGLDLDNLQDYRGLNTRHPWLAFMMLLLLFSMAGVPPTVGFFAKLGLLDVLIQGGYTSLALVALVFALVGAYYYLRLVMYMYFVEPEPTKLQKPIVLSRERWFAITVNGLAALFFGLMPSYLIELCTISLYTGVNNF